MKPLLSQVLSKASPYCSSQTCLARAVKGEAMWVSFRVTMWPGFIAADLTRKSVRAHTLGVPTHRERHQRVRQQLLGERGALQCK